VRADAYGLARQVDISRLEMQCFKGAWISNVLHDGIGIPRITDAQGDQTLTGEKGGELVDEAARRAKEKGLVSKKSSHFQSVDTIGETAVSWTLGKMVIEASKAVKPHGHDVAQPVGTHSRWSQAWTVGRGRVGQALGLPKFERKMDELGLDVFWVFFTIILIFVGLAYAVLRRRFWLTKASLQKRRKRSDAGEVRDWMRMRSQASSSAEEGLLPASPKTLWSGTSRLKPYVHKFSTLVAKVTHNGRREKASRPTWNRQVTSPHPGHIEMPERSEVYSTSTSMSLPGSPKAHESFFVPAHSDSTPVAINGFADKHELTPRPSPSKTALQLMSDGSRSLSAKSSPGSLRSKRTSPLPMTSANGEATGTGGWNDPPGSVFGATDATGHLLGAKGLSSLSRSSSRINLEEYGGSLAVRPISRGPGGDDPGGP
jgi:Golgi apyrase